MATRGAYEVYVGLDAAAATFTAAWCTSTTSQTKPLTLPQSPAGYRQLVHLLRMMAAPASTFVVLEATGSYWVTLAVTLVEAGFAVSVVHPNHAVNYARSVTRRAKTDPRDAELLVQFALERQPPPWTPSPAV